MSQWLVEKSAALLEARTSRRGLLARAAIVGSALAVSPLRYVLRPGTAYAAICGCAGRDCDCGSACCDGYTEFCCVVNNGVNACPPGTFEAGWWRADGSIYCDGPRYYVDCNNRCGCTNCIPCGCAGGDCNHRRAGCNQFRYGNCNTQIGCAGPISCRVVSCTPPYEMFPACNRTLIFDNSTANHIANCPAPPPPPPPVGPGTLVTVAHSGKALDVAGSSQLDGSAVSQWTAHGGPNQRWAAVRQGDGTYKLVAAHSGKLLDVANASMADGAGVQQWSDVGSANQRWRIESLGDGSSRVTAVHSGKVLDADGGSTADGARIQQWTWHGGANQRWKGIEIVRGTHFLAVHSGKALDVEGGSQANGATVLQWTPHGGANQQWVAERLADGTYRIVAAHSGKVLDVGGSSQADGATVLQWEYHGGANQRWRIEQLADGSYRITAAHSGKVLDVNGGSTADGARVQQWAWHGGPNQRWKGLGIQ